VATTLNISATVKNRGRWQGHSRHAKYSLCKKGPAVTKVVFALLTIEAFVINIKKRKTKSINNVMQNILK
jgi:hypothetical protein